MKKLSWLVLLATLLLPSFAYAIDLMPASDDPSVMYLSYIFGVVNGVLHGSGTQILGKMFSIFNMAVLMLASLVAVYTTLMAVLNTGQDGEFLGKKWSSLFVPVRVLFGVLLISPTSTGYSWIQVGVMWIVLQGVGAANYVWQEAVVYLQDGGSLFVANGTGSSASGAANSNYYTVYGWMTPLSYSVFCLEAMNTALNKLTGSSAYSSGNYHAVPTQTPYATVMDALAKKITITTNTVPSNSVIRMPNYPTNSTSSPSASPDVYWSFLNGICGNLNFTGGNALASSDGTYTNVNALGLQQAIYDLDNGIYVPANNICGIDCSSSSCQAKPEYAAMSMPPPAGVADCATPTGYAASTMTSSDSFPIFYWTTTVSDAYAQTMANATNDYLGLVSTYSTGGGGLDKTSTWLDAGSYFFELMSYVGGTQNLSGATFNVSGSNGSNSAGGDGTINQGSIKPWEGIPTTSTPYLQPCNSSVSKNCVSYPTTSDSKTNIPSYLEGIMLPLVATANLQTSKALYVVGNFGNLQTDVNGKTSSPMITAGSVTTGGGEDAAAMMDALTGSASDLYDQIENLTSIDDTSSNPIIIVMKIGKEMINMAFNTWLICTSLAVALGFLIGAIPSNTMSTGISLAFSGVLSIMITLCAPLLLAGCMLLFYFPMVPFMIYTFGVIGWIIGVIEGMVAAPIIGIGIMHPEGHDVFGKGEQALMLLLNMFLRPPLMVFGLITSIMMVYISVWLVNSGMNRTLSQVYDISDGYSGTVGMVAIPIVYTAIIFNIINKCFTMIYILPDKVTRWLSGGQQESLGSDMAGVQEQVKKSAEGGMGTYSTAMGKAAEGSVAGGAKFGKKQGKLAKKAIIKAATSGAGGGGVG